MAQTEKGNIVVAKASSTLAVIPLKNKEPKKDPGDAPPAITNR